MENFFPRVKTKPKTEDVGSRFSPNNSAPSVINNHPNLEKFPADPGLRRAIYEYDVNISEKVRRTYLQRASFQPKNHDFLWSQLGPQKRRFISTRFNDYKPWLEYSIAKDAASCLPCYLFKYVHSKHGGADVFSGEGFRNWKKKDKLAKHVGEHDSNHNKCMRAVDLGHQLDCYIMHMRTSDHFQNLEGIVDLSKMLVQLKKHRVYPLVYLLVKLALILSVATATVKMMFSAMKHVKIELRNQLGDELMNDFLVAYIEKDVMNSIDVEDITSRFQNMAPRRILS